jgi:hypothetical protein
MNIVERRQVLCIVGVVSAHVVLRSPAKASASNRAGFLDVASFRKESDSDDTASFVRALKRGTKIFVPQGKGSGPGGSYIVSRLSLPPNAEIFGEGVKSVLRPARPGHSPCILVESSIGRESISNISIRNLSFVGYSVEEGFSEHRHLISLNGVSGVRLSKLRLCGFQGDGIYLGTGEQSNALRKNQAVDIRDCVFDGLNHQNRNAISVIDCVGIRISNCRFENCTRIDMPGPIDFEPNHPGLEKVGRIDIRHCVFQNCGGMAGQIAIIAPKAEMSFVEYALIEANSFEYYVGVGSDLHIDVQPPIDREPQPRHRIIVRGNTGKRGNRPTVCKAGASINFVNNSWKDYAEASIIGTARGPTVQRLTISDDYARIGLANSKSPALDIRDVGKVFLKDASFTECGGKSAEVIRFVDGTAGEFIISNSTFRATKKSAQRMTFVERGYKFVKLFRPDWSELKYANKFIGFFSM